MPLFQNVANAFHKARHATGGPDAISPADIGAEVAGAAAGKTTAVAAAAAAADLIAAQHTADNSAYAAVSGTSLAGSAVGIFGDSIAYNGESFMHYASVLSKQKIYLQQVVSYPGYTSTALLPKITDITQAAVRVATCVIICGSNNALSSGTVGVFAADITSLVGSLRAAGIQPVLVTVPPNAGNALTARYNIWLRRYAAVQRLILIDLHTLLVDPATGGYKTIYYNDGIHPSNAGHAAIGKLVSDTLSPYLPSVTYSVQPWVGAPNALPNTNFLTSTTTAGLADGWLISGAPGADATPTLVADPAGFNWQRVVLVGSATRNVNPNYVDVLCSPGDLVLLAMRVRSSALADATSKLTVNLTFFDLTFSTNKGNVILTGPVGFSQPITDGLALATFIAPVGSGLAYPTVSIGPGNGTYDFAQPTLYNLTALGIV